MVRHKPAKQRQKGGFTRRPKGKDECRCRLTDTPCRAVRKSHKPKRVSSRSISPPELRLAPIAQQGVSDTGQPLARSLAAGHRPTARPDDRRTPSIDKRQSATSRAEHIL